MARRTGEAGGGAWQWSRTAQTRRGLLDAAREVFGEQGFTAAGVAAVAERAGSSVGSLYHHFGGKAELFLALWEDHQAAHEAAAAGAVAKARARGETDPLALLITGARAYLDCSWERRDAVRLFADGDAPPGFEVQRRERGREWLRQNATLLGAGTGRTDRLTVAVLTAIIGETAREIATCPAKRAANQLTEHAIGLIRRLDPRNRED